MHPGACARYEADRFPTDLAGIPLLVEGYDAGGMAVARGPLNGDPDRDVDAILALPGLAFAHIRNAEAGCFIARIERA